MNVCFKITQNSDDGRQPSVEAIWCMAEHTQYREWSVTPQGFIAHSPVARIFVRVIINEGSGDLQCGAIQGLLSALEGQRLAASSLNLKFPSVDSC
jgi:hypothetical protein